MGGRARANPEASSSWPGEMSNNCQRNRPHFCVYAFPPVFAEHEVRLIPQVSLDSPRERTVVPVS
jgi:hypothetical protein